MAGKIIQLDDTLFIGKGLHKNATAIRKTALYALSLPITSWEAGTWQGSLSTWRLLKTGKRTIPCSRNTTGP